MIYSSAPLERVESRYIRSTLSKFGTYTRRKPHSSKVVEPIESRPTKNNFWNVSYNPVKENSASSGGLWKWKHSIGTRPFETPGEITYQPAAWFKGSQHYQRQNGFHPYKPRMGLDPLFIAKSFDNGSLNHKGSESPVSTSEFRRFHKKIWLMDSFHLDPRSSYNPNGLDDLDVAILFAKFCDNCHKCDVKKFKLTCNYSVSFTNVRRCVQMASTVLIDAPVYQPNGAYVRLEDLLGAMPTIEHFTACTSGGKYLTVDENTASDLCKLQNLEKLKSLRFADMPCVVNLLDLYDFLEIHRLGEKETTITFDSNSLTPIYRESLDTLVNAILDTNDMKCAIYYDDQDERKLREMERRINS